MKIALLFAMQAEAEPLIESLDLVRTTVFFDSRLPFRAYLGQCGQLELLLVTSGVDSRFDVDNVATVPAAVMAFATIDRFSPHLLLNCGTAGGLGAAGCRVGEVYLSTDRFYFHHRRIPLPGFAEYGHGGYPAADTSAMATDLQLPMAIISTGDSLDLAEEDLSLIQNHHATIKDMEAAAIAWVCMQYQLPMFAIKSITDLIDDPTPTGPEFLKNLAIATKNLRDRTMQVLDYMQAKGLSSS